MLYWKVLLITYRLTYGVVEWELFSFFSIFCIMPFGDCTLPQPPRNHPKIRSGMEGCQKVFK